MELIELHPLDCKHLCDETTFPPPPSHLYTHSKSPLWHERQFALNRFSNSAIQWTLITNETKNCLRYRLNLWGQCSTYVRILHFRLKKKFVRVNLDWMYCTKFNHWTSTYTRFFLLDGFRVWRFSIISMKFAQLWQIQYLCSSSIQYARTILVKCLSFHLFAYSHVNIFFASSIVDKTSQSTWIRYIYKICIYHNNSPLNADCQRTQISNFDLVIGSKKKEVYLNERANQPHMYNVNYDISKFRTHLWTM